MDPALYVIPWTGAAILIGYIGKETKMGFWIAFIISMLLSPMVGILAVLLSPPRNKKGGGG